MSLLAVSRWEEQFLINASTLNQVEGGVVDLAFTSTTTYQMGLVVSKDSLSEDDDVIQPKSNDDLRLFLENVHFLPVVLCSAHTQ